MSLHSEGKTTVVATYTARHYADMARDYLEDNEIPSYVSADDVHVPLQLTEGARLIVMEREVDAARTLLREASMLPDDLAVPDEE
jgi:hypothetical protein